MGQLGRHVGDDLGLELGHGRLVLGVDHVAHGGVFRHDLDDRGLADEVDHVGLLGAAQRNLLLGHFLGEVVAGHQGVAPFTLGELAFLAQGDVDQAVALGPFTGLHDTGLAAVRVVDDLGIGVVVGRVLVVGGVADAVELGDVAEEGLGVTADDQVDAVDGLGDRLVTLQADMGDHDDLVGTLGLEGIDHFLGGLNHRQELGVFVR